jgi:protein-disulfide isomerase
MNIPTFIGVKMESTPVETEAPAEIKEPLEPIAHDPQALAISKLEKSVKHLTQIVIWLAILVVGLTLIAATNLYFTGKLVLNPPAAQSSLPEEVFSAGHTIPASIPRNGMTLGNPNAPVTVEMFSDFQCPYCKRANDSVNPAIIERYVATGKVKFVYHLFSFLGQESVDSANGSICALDQGKFWEYKEALFANQKSENSGGFSLTRLVAIGKFVGLNIKQFTDCLQSNKHADQVQQLTQEGAQMGVQGTPTYFVNGKIVGQNDDMFQMIEDGLK